MSGLHDPADEIGTVPLDMDAIAAAATARKRQWRLEFDSQGRAYNWTGEAASASLADSKARAELWEASATFSRYKARLVACVEV